VADDLYLTVAERAVRRAASVLDDAARDLRRLPAHARDRADVAATAGAEAENAAIATLRAAFPDHAILGRDSAAVLGDISNGRPGSCRWLVDPLCGATNFAHGFPYSAVSLVLIQGPQVTHAVVLDPARDELFVAAADRGARLNGTSLSVSTCHQLDGALVATAFPRRDSEQRPRCVHALDALIGCGVELRRAGAVALELAQVAAGRLDAFYAIDARPWELAAGALLIDEAGGRAGDFAGGREVLRAHDFIGAAPGVFGPLREALTALR
jgi:myo-inositol-1(or 4)-monophosphatase